jgi:xylulokinase
MSLLGIDVGTTGCKAVVFSESGKIYSSEYEEYSVKTSLLGYAELDSAEVWNKVKRVIAKAALEAGQDTITALSATSLGESMVPVTRDRKILGDSMLFADTRGREEIHSVSSIISEETFYQINGNVPGVQYSLAKMLWIEKHDPELYARTDKFLLWGSFVTFMLGGEPAVDYSLANRTLLFDINEKKWSKKIINAVGLDESKLAQVVQAGTVIGQISKEISQELSLPQDVTIVAGGHDQCVNSLGCGVIEHGQAMYGMGTFLCAVPVFGERLESNLMMEYGLNTEDHVCSDHFVSFIFNQGGNLVKWFRDTFAASDHKMATEKDKEVYDLLFAEIPDAAVDVTVLPYFTGTGPPKFYTETFGQISGLNLSTTRGEILKGILQGATFYLAKTLDQFSKLGLNISEYRSAGGGSRSQRWVQLSADIFDKPFLLTHCEEAGALGSAIIAGTGQGIFNSLKQGVDAMVQTGKTIEPNPANTKCYLEKLENYKQTERLAEEHFSQRRRQQNMTPAS